MGPDAEIPRIPTKASKMVTNQDYSFPAHGLHSNLERAGSGEYLDRSRYSYDGILLSVPALSSYSASFLRQ